MMGGEGWLGWCRIQFLHVSLTSSTGPACDSAPLPAPVSITGIKLLLNLYPQVNNVVCARIWSSFCSVDC